MKSGSGGTRGDVDGGVVALDALTGRLAEARTLADVANVLTRFAADVLGASTAVLALAGREPGKLVLAGHHALEDALVGPFSVFDEDVAVPLARAHRERRAIVFESIEQLAQREPDLAAFARDSGRSAGAALPLMIGARSAGALGIAFGAPRTFDADDRALIAAIARQAALAIDRAELLDRAQRETARVRYLAHAGALLASTTSPRETLATLARLAVPELADWAAVDMFVDAHRVERLAVAHVDPAKVALVEELVRRYPPNLDDPADGLGRILRTGEPQLVPEIPEALLELAAKDEEHLRVMRALGLCSYVCVPIASRDRIRGAFTLISSESGRRYAQDDLELALEIARRASVALDVADTLDELRAAERAARDASARLELADRKKDEFLAMLGHELRNPLAAIATASELVRLGATGDPLIERAQEAIGRQVLHMKRMLDDLLDVARIARGRIELARETVDLGEIVRSTSDDHRAEIEKAGVALAVDVPATPIFVEGDRTRLAQVVANLVHNARKFTPRGGHVTVRALVEGDEAALVVQDDGMGIAADALAELFEPLMQAQRVHHRNDGGLGLGLALTKQIAALHGGTVEATSAGVGRGSTFTVRLPRTRAMVEPSAAPASLDAGPMRVLLVEDDPDAGDLLQILLETMGHEVALVIDGESALERASALRPGLVLCDIGLPGAMDGYAVARALRDAKELGDPLLVALTGFGVAEHERRARSSGFDRFVTKPIDVTTLAELVEAASARRSA